MKNENSAKIYEFITEKFRSASEKILGAEVTQAIEAHAQVPGRTTREPQWINEVKPKLIKKFDADTAQLEYFYGLFRRANRREYEEHGAITVYTVDDKGEVVPK